jgi:hypothetical protein
MPSSTLDDHDSVIPEFAVVNVRERNFEISTSIYTDSPWVAIVTKSCPL